MAEQGTRKQRLLEHFVDVRRATELLAAPLSPEDQQLQSMPSASPTKWHRAHTSWFFESFVLGPRGVPPFHPRYSFLFNSYYETVGPRHARPQRGLLSRPSADEIGAYRRAVDGRMVELIEGSDDAALDALAPLVELGLAHEQQHQELILTDILHAFSLNPLLPAYFHGDAGDGAEPLAVRSSPASFVEHEGGLVEIGAARLGRTDDGYAFDNEAPRHRVWLDPFALADRPVTVAEVRAFIDDGGYRTPSLWLAEGLDWVRQHAIEAPIYLFPEGHKTYEFGLHGLREARPDDTAAHLSYYEADAIARYLSARLPTEAEWENAAILTPQPPLQLRGEWEAEQKGRPLSTKLERGSEGPRAHGRGEAGAGSVGPLHPKEGAARTTRRVWEWTGTGYGPYPGYRPAAGALGEYNGKFMANQLVLRGGSSLTPRGHAGVTYRNFWHPDTRFQMAGVRLARSL